MPVIHLAPLRAAYPFINLGGGPTHQCAIRMSRCLEQAYPEFHATLLKWAEHRRMFTIRQPRGEHFRKAQDIATLLADVRNRTGKWTLPQPTIARTPAEIRDLRSAIDRSDGLIFFQNFFRAAPAGEAGLPAELRVQLDGQGDHIDLHLADRAARMAPAVARREAARHDLRFSNHIEVWDSRVDAVWFWPLQP